MSQKRLHVANHPIEEMGISSQLADLPTQAAIPVISYWPTLYPTNQSLTENLAQNAEIWCQKIFLLNKNNYQQIAILDTDRGKVRENRQKVIGNSVHHTQKLPRTKSENFNFNSFCTKTLK